MTTAIAASTFFVASHVVIIVSLKKTKNKTTMLGLILRVTQTVTSAFSALKIKYNLQIQCERNK